MSDYFCFAEFLGYYTSVQKNYNDQQHEYQPSFLPVQYD